MSARFIRFIHRFENSLAYLSLFLLALVPFLEVVARKFFHTGVPNSSVYLQHLVLVATFLAGAITSREGKHLTLSLGIRLRDPVKTIKEVTNAVLCASVTFAFAWTSLYFVFTAIEKGEMIGVLSKRLVALVMVLGYGLMAIRFVLTLTLRRRWKALALALGFVCGMALAVNSVAGIVGMCVSHVPGFFKAWQSALQPFLASSSAVLIAVLVVSAFFGAPIFIVLGGIGYILFVHQGLFSESNVPDQVFAMLTEKKSLAAIPLFAMVGFLLSESKAGERMVKLFQSFFAWFPGGLSVMAILVCAFFTTFTGASGVTIIALGGLLSYILMNGGYAKKFTVGLLTASGSIGLLFPPSLPVIIYGVIAGVNIKHMFIGGILPGLALVLAMALMAVVYSLKNRVERHPFRIGQTVKLLGASFWELLLPVIIVAGYFGGVFFIEESAAIAVFYILIVEVFIKRDLKIRDLPRVLLKCLPIIGGVLTILALANALSNYIIDAQIPTQLMAWVQATVTSKYVFLLLLNLALLVVGCFLDIFSAILVVVPLIIPLGNLFHIHPVHLGIIFLANMELGYLTPPVGLNLYLSSYRFNEPMVKVYRDVILFLLIQLGTVLLITYVPFLTTALLKK